MAMIAASRLTSGLFTKEHRLARAPSRILVAHPMHDMQNSASSGRAFIAPRYDTPEAGDGEVLWTALMDLFKPREDDFERYKEEFGPYAIDPSLPPPKTKTMYGSHMFERLATEQHRRENH
eukprot:gene10578-12237_t